MLQNPSVAHTGHSSAYDASSSQQVSAVVGSVVPGAVVVGGGVVVVVVVVVEVVVVVGQLSQSTGQVFRTSTPTSPSSPHSRL